MNWMLPLETLPGWPEAPAVSDAHMIWLLFIAPLAVFLVISVLAWTPKLAARFRGEEQPAPSTEVARREQPAAPGPSA